MSSPLHRRYLLSLALVGVVAWACGAASAPTTPTSAGSQGSSTAALCETAPAPSDMSAWGPPASAPDLVPFLVTNYIACGQARILLLFLDASSNVASAPDRTAHVDFYNLGRDPNAVAASADGTFIWTIENERGMYIVNVSLPEAGTWGAEVTTEAPGSPAEAIRLTFEVHDTSPTVAVGAKAPATDTPTLADVGDDISLVSTDTDPVESFYSTSVADAIAERKPFVLIFATPKFCTSAQCGPTLDKIKPIAEAHPDVTFINVEPYKLEAVDGRLQPELDANGSLQATEATKAWGLLTEPWIFAVDGDGIVRGSYELIVSDAELESAIAEITAG